MKSCNTKFIALLKMIIMRTIKYIYLGLQLLIFIVLFSFPSAAQESVKTKKILMNIEASDGLVKELRNLVNRERECDYYEKSLIWTIEVSNQDRGNSILYISMQREINVNYEYVGFFYLDETLFLISGANDRRLFSALGKKELEFKHVTRDTDIMNLKIQDYSTWVYVFHGGILCKKEEYLLPCNR